jgi:3-hydroxybutyryl-CoA dehydrogenase
MGPFELIDLIGVDVNLEVARSFFRQRPVARWRPHPLQSDLVAAGRLGRKTGHGFHRYDAEGRLLTGHAHPDGGLRREILERLVATLVNEACFAVDDDVAAPEAIDTAMRLGLNHPRGPFEWAELFGAGRIAATLEALAREDRERYAISPYLRGLAERG